MCIRDRVRDAPKLQKRRKRKGEKETARRRKGGEEKQSNGCTRSFYNSYSGEFLAEKIKLLGARGPFGDNVFKNSVHTKQILKGGSYNAFDNLGAATWKDPSPFAEP